MTIDTKTKPKQRKSTRRKKGKAAETPQYPELQDSFQRSTQEQEQSHLLEQHQAKLQTQEELHQAQLKALREQLQVQLFKIWTEVWLQRQKVMQQAYKEWLKVLMS